jgi:hypothetical protein
MRTQEAPVSMLAPTRPGPQVPAAAYGRAARAMGLSPHALARAVRAAFAEQPSEALAATEARAYVWSALRAYFGAPAGRRPAS